MVAVAVAEPEVAVMVAVPSATEVTTPSDDTVATEALDVVHVTVAPEIVVPLASFTVAMSVAVAPSDVNERLVADSVIDEGICTVAEAVAVAEPDVAVIVAVPSATAVTKPADETVAIALSDDDQVTVAPDIVVPPESFTVALSVAVSPLGESVRLVGASVTDDAT